MIGGSYIFKASAQHLPFHKNLEQGQYNVVGKDRQNRHTEQRRLEVCGEAGQKILDLGVASVHPEDLARLPVKQR